MLFVNVVQFCMSVDQAKALCEPNIKYTFCLEPLSFPYTLWLLSPVYLPSVYPITTDGSWTVTCFFWLLSLKYSSYFAVTSEADISCGVVGVSSSLSVLSTSLIFERSTCSPVRCMLTESFNSPNVTVSFILYTFDEFVLSVIVYDIVTILSLLDTSTTTLASFMDSLNSSHVKSVSPQVCSEPSLKWVP